MAGRLAVAVFLGICLLASGSAQALTAAERLAVRAGEDAMAIARADGNAARVAARFQTSMRRYSSTTQLAAFALGAYRRDLPAARRREFNHLVERFAGQFFATYHGDFIGRRIEIVSSRPMGRGDTLVKTRIVSDGASQAREVEWRIVSSGGRPRVFDVKVRGIWLALLMRSQFVSILKSNRGSMDALFAYLRK